MKIKTFKWILLLISMICSCTQNFCENECVNLEKRTAKVPEAPKKFQAIAGNCSVLLTWQAFDNPAYKYILTYDGKEIEVAAADGFFTVNDLENGREYEFLLYSQEIDKLKSEPAKATATPEEKLNVIPEKPAFHIWFITFDESNRPTGDSRDGYSVLNEGGDFGDGIVTQAEEFVNNPDEVSKRVIKYSGAAYAVLRDGEDIRWYTMKKVGYHWEVWGYVYNAVFENSNAELDETITELELATALDLQKYNTKLKPGVKITTRGYYEENDGGAATYYTALRTNGKKFSTMRTGTGQIVNYELQDMTVNIRQFGAGYCRQINTGNEDISCTYTDWQADEKAKYEINDDHPRFGEAMSMLAESSNDGELDTKIIVPPGEYRIAQQFNIGMKNFTMVGVSDSDGKCKSVIYTDNGYQTVWEFFFSIWGSEKMLLDSVRIEARETKTAKYYRQLVLVDSADVTIKNCEVYVDEHVQDDDSSLDRQYTNVTVYSGVKNAIVENCILTNHSGVERGACVGVMDFYGHGTENIKILNNTMYQNCHDEMLGVFSSQRWYAPDAYVHNVLISGNTMYPSNSTASRRVMAVTLGYNDSYGLEDIVFEKNHIIAQIPSNLITCGTLDNTTYIRENIFDLNMTGSGGVIFDSRENVVIENNTVNFAEDSTGICSVFKNKGKFIGNTVNVYGKLGSFSYLGGEISDNEFNIYGSVDSFTLDVDTVKNNVFNVHPGSRPIKKMFCYDSFNESVYKVTDIEICGNTINYNVTAEDEAAFIAENGWKQDWGWNGFHCLTVGGQFGAIDRKIKFTDNTISAPSVSSVNKHLMYYSFKENDTLNDYVLQNNKLEKFTWVRSQMGAKFDVMYDNTDLHANKLEFDSVLSDGSRKGKNYIIGMYNVGK